MTHNLGMKELKIDPKEILPESEKRKDTWALGDATVDQVQKRIGTIKDGGGGKTRRPHAK